jgi:hypothetical protein
MALSHRPVWTLPVAEVYQSLATTANGLSEDEAARRLKKLAL